MRKWFVLTLFAVPLALTAAPFVHADKGSDDATKEYARFEGSWNIASAEMGGQALPAEALKGTLLTCKGSDFTYKEGERVSKGTFKVDPSKKPRQIDITFGDGPMKGMTVLGIYEVDGDSYKLCLDLGGKKRPTEFKSGDMVVLEVLKKVKAEKK